MTQIEPIYNAISFKVIELCRKCELQFKIEMKPKSITETSLRLGKDNEALGEVTSCNSYKILESILKPTNIYMIQRRRMHCFIGVDVSLK